VARTRFRVEVLTPEGGIFDEEVELLSTRTTIGSIGLLAHHEPMLAILEPTELRLYRSENEILRFAQAEGYLQFAENRALILVEEAIEPERLSAAELEERAKQARSDREKAADGSEAQARAERDLRRAEAFLTVLEGN
jgi:F-type H+-transporting ATPase subunit epsilon